MVGYWLAHGALGYWDEAIFVAVVIAFLSFMALSWVNARNAEPTFDDENKDPAPERVSAGDRAADDATDRFRLD